MRLIKLSPQDPEMRTRDDVLDFFNRKLWLKSRAGKFGLTENKRRMTGIHKGALLVFSYRKECMFVARSSSGIITRKDPESPGYFVVELASIEAVSSTLEAYQRALKRHGVLDKELVHTQAWPRLSDACEEATLGYFNYPSRRRVLFARIGWMLQYRGPLPGDERPVGGGKYNRTDTGHELYNFLPVASKLYGYFQPQMRKDETALERVESGAQGASLENVTVIFVARRPKGGQVIVGWYGGAKLFRSLGPKVAGRATHLPQYRCIANVRDSVLLPEKMRRLPIPHGPGGFGQANVCYPLERDGSRKSRRWMAQALSYTSIRTMEKICSSSLRRTRRIPSSPNWRRPARAGQARASGQARKTARRLKSTEWSGRRNISPPTATTSKTLATEGLTTCTA